ncbi:MAG: glycosyltransferase family 2 protein [Candidatus Omnitrophica bacterium]|nr:glycosyltransferase family 2 protein [Candidatus Omnitrophota bacterium]
MAFHFTRRGLSQAEHRRQRLFECLPGGLSWATILGLLLLSWWRPLTAAIVIIAFDLYWLLRLFYMTLFLMLSYFRLSLETKTDWMARLRELAQPTQALEHLARTSHPQHPKAQLSQWLHRRALRSFIGAAASAPRWQEVYHVILFPIFREDPAIIEAGVQSVLRQTFPAKQIVVVLAVEARAEPQILAGARELQARYRGQLLELLVTVHPDGVPGEAQVKGANATWAAKAAEAALQRHGIPLEQALMSCFDADTVVSAHYCACLTYGFLTTRERTRASFQPIPVYHNNIWEVPGFARVLDIGSSFFQLIEATNPEQLVTFSSHSMSFKALADVGYWPVDMVSDDSAIFWKALFHYEGRYRVIPLPITVSMDVVSAPTWWSTVRSVYKQKRRWAWGVENLPIVFRGFLHAKAMPRLQRLRYVVKLLEMNWAWATWPLLLTVIGWLPVLAAQREFSSTVLYYSAPRIQATIFELSSLSFAVTIWLSWMLLPKPRVKYSLLKRLGLALEWLCIPLITVCFIAVPALDAQTRLLAGRRMEFWVTGKRHPGGRLSLRAKSRMMGDDEIND